MWGLSSSIPFLLAFTTPRDLTKSLQTIYVELEQATPVSWEPSPTLRFSYVSPTVNGTSTWRNNTYSARPDENPRPVALYLPGLDGYGISGSQQFDDLADSFQLWRLTVQLDDRSSLSEMVDTVEHFLDRHENVTLIGESCGGFLAVSAALKRKDALKGLVLVNPATSFDRSPWGDLVPLLTALPTGSSNNFLSPYALLGTLILSTIIPDLQQTRRIIETILELPSLQRIPSPSVLWDLNNAMMESMMNVEARLPADVLQHRVEKWLEPGVPMINSRLDRLTDVPTLVVVGAQDRLLPSKSEAERLQGIWEGNAETLVVPDRGHFVLDDTVNLTEAILYSKLFREPKKYDPITDWKLPSTVDEYVKTAVAPFRDIFSPVYFSTDANGKHWQGLTKVPQQTNGPLLFVGNHQFDLYEQCGVYVRGLAHPVNFVASTNLNFELDGRVPGIVQDSDPSPLLGGFEKYGAVMVTPKNYYRLLQTGQDTLLFPGGAAEALSGNTSYPLFWPEKVDFVRTAARFNATIIPFSAVGMVDSVQVVAEPQQIYNLPFVGERARRTNNNITAARYDTSNEDEVLGFPVAVPSTPKRNYFLFGAPIDTTEVDPKDKEACTTVYQEARQQVEKGLSKLLTAREKDPFQNSIQRVAYEKAFGKQAPTFGVDELNN